MGSENRTRSPCSSPSSPFCLRLPKPPLVFTSNKDSGSQNDAVLKRKRPTRLNIPVSGHAFCVPATPSAVARDVVEAEGDGYSVYCKRGRKEYMEDRYTAGVNLRGENNLAFFGVFDGHGGAKAAEFAANNLENNILDEVIMSDEDDVEEAVKRGYLNTDSEFMKKDLHGGSCCVTTFIRNGNLVVSNAGDCRAVISRGGVVEALTSDHRPSWEDEKDRIETLRPSLHQRWEGFKGERRDGDKPTFSVKRSSMIGRARTGVTVEVYNNPGEEYHIEGCFSQRCCTVFNAMKETVAEIHRKVDPTTGVMLGKEVLSLCVKPAFDAAFAMGLVLVLDQISGDGSIGDDATAEPTVHPTIED